MNRKWIIIGLLVCVLLIAAYFVFGGKNSEPLPVETVAAQPKPLSTSLPSSDVVPPAHQAPPSVLPPVPPGVVIPPEVAKDPTALAYFLSVMTPISFYGKVVDEKGTPIEGATAKISVTDKMFKDGSTYNKMTDGAGLFSISDVHGLGVGITVSKEGYYQLPKSYGVYGYAPGISSDGPKPTPDNPAVFVLRKKGQGVALILKSVSQHLPRNGAPVSLDLEAGLVVNSNAGNFQIALSSSVNETNPNSPYDWKYSLSVPGGGLVERTDNLNFMAPNDGYQASAEGSFSSGQPRYSRAIDKQYFVKLADGKYARIQVSLNGDANSHFVVSAYINPTPGQQNLESASQ
jgi:hypothetical protein